VERVTIGHLTEDESVSIALSNFNSEIERRRLDLETL
jgi:hypothetical protein